MADKYVDFSIRIHENGSDAIKKIGVSAVDLSKGIRAVKSEVDSLNAQVVNWAQAAQAAEGIGAVVQQLNGAFSDLTSAYQVQIVAETQLQTVMAQRMQATEADIASIKELCSAQQQLGVIGDEVAISGAQQMATFLSEKASLDVLIPAMNNLLAQQKGLNATNQDAVGIGNMMGKALQGSTEVLQRVGISFTDAQKQVLKYGNESERAAMLAEVIRDNVGEMNAALAATDAGKQKQLENTLGDVKEQLGAVVQGAMPIITVSANLSMAATGAMRFYTSIKAVAAALKVKRTALVATDVATKKLTASTVTMTAAYTMGLSVAIYAVVKLYQALTDSADDATDAQDTLKESTESFNTTVANTKAAIDMELASLAKLIKEKGNDASMVATLNRKYGESLGYHKSAAEWYDVLITKSADYCRALGYEAQAKVVASQKAAKELELEALKKKKEGLERSGTAYEHVKVTTGGTGGARVMNHLVKSAEYSQLEKDIAIAESAVSQLGETFDACMTKMQESASALSTTTTELNAQQQSYDQLSKAIEDNDKTLKSLAPDQVADINRIKTKNAELKKQRDELGKVLGLNQVVKKPGKDNSGKEELTLPAQLNTIKEIDQAIAYQSAQKSKATKDNIAGINQEIARLQALKKELDELGVPTKDDKSKATVAPQDISKLNTLKELQEAIAYYQELQRNQSSAEIVETQRTIDKLTEKQDAMHRLIDLPSMQQEVAQLGGMSGMQLKMELKLLGLDDVQKKIRGLQKLLADTKNPLGDDQRKEVVGLVDAYSDYEKILKKSNVSIRGAWGAISGIGDGVESITAALDSNASTWQKVSTIIDSAIQIYDGFMGVFQIIQSLTSLSAGHAATKVVEAGAETTAATATAASAAVTTTASGIVASALGIETAQWSALAAAKTFAAHAEIPFAGTGIAAGFIAMQQGIISTAAIPKFASGCLAYGPTLGLFGEYSGAANNPEVVAPLDRLKALIGTTDSGSGGKVEFKIKGRNLVGTIARETKARKRS